MAAGRFFRPHRVWICIVLLCLIGAGAVVWHLSRPEDKGPSAPKDDPHAQTSGEAIGQPQGHPPRRRPAGDVPRGRLIPGVDFPFEVKTPHVNKDGRRVRPGDCDGDGLKDDLEMRRYGTLKYNSRTGRNVVRLDRPPRRVDPEDTDEDGLPDKWEMKYFGHLRYDRYDDPDEDGWPNHVEYSHQKSGMTADPTQIDLMTLKGTPSVVVHSSYGKLVFSTSTKEFRRKQDAAREKLLAEGGQALVEARTIKPARRPTTKAATAASTRPSG